MAWCRFDVGQGAIAWFVTGSLLLASACSGDSNVSFDDAPPSNSGGDTSSGGSKLSGSGSGSGAAASGGSSAESGAAQGGQSNGASGEGTAGGSTAGSSTAGTASNAGSNAGGKNSGGGNAGGKNGGGTAGKGSAGNGGSGGNDECTPASFGQHSYYFCGLVDSALLAAAKCQSLDMNMVSIESELENAFVLGKQKGSSWLGGTDELSEGHWIWAATGVMFWDEGQAIPDVYTNFLALQPNDNGADGAHENCLVLTASGWNDLVCSLSGFRAACESAP